MKLKSYKLLFRILSLLSDKTNGAHFFVKYKLLLGSIIIGLTGIACTSRNSPSQVTCYDMTAPPRAEDSLKINNNSDTLDDPEIMITCYEMTAPHELENKKLEE